MTNGFRVRLRELPLRLKLLLTVAIAGFVVAAVASHWSFRYWRGEAMAAAEQQALMAAVSLRASVESALVHGQRAQARAGLRRLTATAPVTAARVYAADGTIVLSADESEEGARLAGVWIPSGRELPDRGLVRSSAADDVVRAFLPLTAPGATVLEVRFSVAPLKAAMDRGGRLGIGLLIASVVAMTVIYSMMFEREVVGRVRRMSGLLDAPQGEGGSAGTNELSRLEASVVELVEKERQALREAAAQRRRMAEQAGLAQVGELAAEMAHEFKRPLASIRTAVELLRQEYALAEGGTPLVAALESQLERLNETMRDVFALAKPAEHEPEPLVLRQAIDGALMQIAGHPAAARVRVIRTYDSELPLVRGDAKRLEQAFANLLLNAAEAMPDGGTITVAAAQAGVGWVEVTVSDTGVGIPPAEIERVLKPFYSTKPAGTGLGLPLVARIVASHGGRLTLESDPNRGTTARVHLPTGSPIADPAMDRIEGREAEEAMWQTPASW